MKIFVSDSDSISDSISDSVSYSVLFQIMFSDYISIEKLGQESKKNI